jgi:hypothetical protein
MSEFDFGPDWDVDGHDAPVSDGSEGLGALDHDAGFEDYGHDAGFQDLGHDQDFGHDFADGLGHDSDLSGDHLGDDHQSDDFLGDEHLGYDDEYGHAGAFDLVGADPDEEGLWDQLMLDMTDDVNPYVVN